MRLHEVMWPNKYAMDFFGLWSMHSDVTLIGRLFAYFRLILGSAGVVSMLAGEVMTVVLYWGDMGVLGDFGSLIVVHSLLAVKILYFFWNRRSFRSVYQHLKDFWNISDDPQEREYFERPAKVARFVTFVFFIAGTGNVLSFEAVAFVSWIKNRRINESLRHRPLLLEIEYGFDTQRTPIYEFIFIWQSFGGAGVVAAIVGFDCTVMVFIVHVSAQFRLIAARFRTIGRKISERRVVNDEHEFEVEIGKCVAQHQFTIKVTEQLNALLSPLMFGQIVTSGMEICLGGYALIEGEGGGADLVKFSMLFVTLLIQLVLWCAPAELLIRESSAVAETIYRDVPWFALTPSLQRDLGFVMMRAQKACNVTALYQVMSIRRITEVFNAAGSYLALLRSMKK